MLPPGQSVGRYDIESMLGRGAMGTVYRAKDKVLRREVALKVLELEADEELDDEARSRFVREARAAAGITHTNIVAVFDVGEHEGVPYLAMELVVGSTLRKMIGDESISIPMRVRWLLEIARALREAHAHNLVHRDVKPDNVLVSSEGVTKLADFGIVKQRRRESQPTGGSGSSGPMSFRTRTGQLVGTPEYMAPEQWHSSDVDGRADQFAWGLIAYELLTAKPLPLGRPNPIASVMPTLADDIARCVTRAIEHRRDDRYDSMSDIIPLLEPYAASEVTEAALRRSLPPSSSPSDAPSGTPTKLTRAEMVAPTVEMSTGDHLEAKARASVLGLDKTMPLQDAHLAAAKKPLETPRVRIDHSKAASTPKREDGKRPSATRTFLTAVGITLAIAAVVAAALIALTK